MDRQEVDVRLSAQRLHELMLWHGTDEGNLPPANTLENLSRDTIAALRQLERAHARIAVLRSALAQAFWACGVHELRELILNALGPPPEDDELAAEGPQSAAARQPAANGFSAVA